MSDEADNEDDIYMVIDLASMLTVLMAQRDAETAIDGMHRVCQIIVERAMAIQKRLYAKGEPAEEAG